MGIAWRWMEQSLYIGFLSITDALFFYFAFGSSAFDGVVHEIYKPLGFLCS